MLAPTRNSLASLIARYRIHPNLLDLYVEGKFDRDFLNFIIDDRGYSHAIKVYDIDTVDIPNELIDQLNVKKIWGENSLNFKSNKHRLIAFAYELTRTVGASNVTCFVDADCDRLTNSSRKQEHVLYTDYTCMETYALSKVGLKKFFELTCNLNISKLDEFISLSEAILPSQFVLRAVNDSLKLNSAIPNYSKGIIKKGSMKSFSPEKLLSHYINEHGLQYKQESIKMTYESLLEKCHKDLQHKSHGHDFIELLYDFVSVEGSIKFSGKDEQVREHGNRILFSSLPSSFIFKEKAFSSLEAALSPSAAKLWGKSKQQQAVKPL